ncbi:MAG: hypothetical protein F4110_13415 [Acidimicrobiaceae bacterium]|nr:hypothetical protein [Acidimicrobiaceae bacterium]MXZ99239.1 hypothetical protein [Acidimicrobiaceae bacterium]MYE77198.1 hypothetical protein [Acidimicrobiaceae bacterium]MYE97756.1 hypothetical protein [Acidimicrobiaceae bacterium]MYH43307.1 hypothetical protein [Acidimicrobiaceae bacterium]
MRSGPDRTAEARSILRDNDRGTYTVPTAGLYPFQWNWDSLFAALGWAQFDMARAWTEIETLFKAQWPSGMVPHIVFWSEAASYFPGPDVWRAGRVSPPSSGISQPPVAATVVRRLAEIDRLPPRSLYESIERWHRWWHRARDPEGRGVIAVSHPWESGRDNLPDWDRSLYRVAPTPNGGYARRDLDHVEPAMRPHKTDYDRYLALIEHGVSTGWDDDAVARHCPFWVADPGVTAVLLRAERDLAWLGESLGADTGDVRRRIDRIETGFEQFWSEAAGTYCSLDLRTGEHAEAGTSASFLAPYAGIDRHADRLLEELNAWSEACAYLVPSFDPRHRDFEPVRYWRGPVWCMVNYMISTGLAELGQPDWAERLRADTAALITASGIPESFDPMTGGPVGGSNFTWTAALWLAWASKPHNPDNDSR